MRCFTEESSIHQQLEELTTLLEPLFSEYETIKKNGNDFAEPFLAKIVIAKDGGPANDESDAIALQLKLRPENIRFEAEKVEYTDKINAATKIFNVLLEEAVTSFFAACSRESAPTEILLSISGILLLYHFRKEYCLDSVKLDEGTAGNFDSFTEAFSNIYESLGDKSQRSLSTLFGNGLQIQVFESCSNGILTLTLTLTLTLSLSLSLTLTYRNFKNVLNVKLKLRK